MTLKMIVCVQRTTYIEIFWQHLSKMEVGLSSIAARRDAEVLELLFPVPLLRGAVEQKLGKPTKIHRSF